MKYKIERMKYKIGDEVKLTEASKNYTGKYAGTFARIDELDQIYCNVIGYDGKKFMLPYTYIEESELSYSSPTYPKCQCGAEKVYGKDCPAYYHYDYCPLYKKKE